MPSAQDEPGEPAIHVEAEREAAAGAPAGRSWLGGVFFGLLGLVSLLYLVNPGAGIFELIPDNLPFVGNLDDAFFNGLLVLSLGYFGLDLTRFLRWRKDK